MCVFIAVNHLGNPEVKSMLQPKHWVSTLNPKTERTILPNNLDIEYLYFIQ